MSRNGIGFGLLGLIISTTRWLYLITINRNLKKLRDRFFQQNGGLLLLSQQPSSNQAGMQMKPTKIFTAHELEQATNHYSKDRVLGLGMYGAVYKGVLNNDPQQIVAIKRSGDWIRLEYNNSSIKSSYRHRLIIQM